MRTVSFILGCCLLALVAGCENQNAKSPTLQPKQQQRQLKRQLEQAESENKQLQQQIATLAGLPADVRFANLYDLQSVKITRYTNLYDKNKDGKKEKLIVYIQPIDQDGDIVKAVGTVEVQLWSLDKKADKALLGQWNIEPKQLRKLWYATMLTINYRLIFDVDPEIADSKDVLTVKIKFTDYLTGKVFKEQRAIKR